MKKQKVTLALVPASLPGANELLTKIGSMERALTAIKEELEATVAQAREVANQKAGPIEEKLASYLLALETFATANRATLLFDEKKSVVLPGGEFGWRISPPKVTYGKGGAEKAIFTLTALNLKQYLRYTAEIDREALLRDRPAVADIRFTQKENFYVKPESEKAPDCFPGTPEQHSA